jgi:hypothetical protein
MEMQGDTTIVYRLDLGGGEIVEFEIDAEQGLAEASEGPPPDWARLAFFRCEHCPEREETEVCRLAVSLVRVVDRFQAIISHDRVGLEVVTPQRRVCQETTAQRAMSSLMGLLIATSGCPHTEFLRPMARFHLPLANEHETVFRAVSSYMLAQYYRHRHGLPVDLELTGLDRLYHDLQIVNMSVVKRLRKASRTDSSVNALILLDLYAKAMPFSLAESLAEFRHLFSAYLRAR